MSHISFSSPFIRGFTHSDEVTSPTIGTGGTILTPAISPERRVIVIIQNQHASAVITVRFAETGTAGLKIKAGENITLNNFNGRVRASSDTASTPIHVAYAVC